MSTSDLLYELLDKRKITLSLSRTSANSLRVSLLKAFKIHKEQAEALGWLADDLVNAVVSMEYTPPSGDSEFGTASFYLRPRKHPPVNYALLIVPDPIEPTETEIPENDPN